MELIFILFGIIVVAAIIVKASNKSNKTDVIPKNSQRDLTLSGDDIIRLRETVGKFKKGEKHYCNNCDSVSIHLEEDLSGETFSTFSIFAFLLPWKWAIVASLFFLKDEEIQTVCISCNPSFYEDWLSYSKIKSKVFFRNTFENILLLLMLYVILMAAPFFIVGNIFSFNLSLVLFVFFPICIFLFFYIIFYLIPLWIDNGKGNPEYKKWVLACITLVFLAILTYLNNSM